MEQGLTRALPATIDGSTEIEADRDDLQMLSGGDPSALERIFDRHHSHIYRFASRMLGDADEAADATQEAFLRLAQQRRRAGRIRSLRAWLVRVAQNACRDRFRMRRRTAGPVDPEAAETEGAVTGVDALAVRDALNELPVAQAAAVVLRFYFDYPYRDIAEVQGITEGTARARACRGLQRLRRLLTEGGTGDE